MISSVELNPDPLILRLKPQIIAEVRSMIESGLFAITQTTDAIAAKVKRDLTAMDMAMTEKKSALTPAAKQQGKTAKKPKAA